jgi:hypothetical protein
MTENKEADGTSRTKKLIGEIVDKNRAKCSPNTGFALFIFDPSETTVEGEVRPWLVSHSSPAEKKKMLRIIQKRLRGDES